MLPNLKRQEPRFPSSQPGSTSPDWEGPGTSDSHDSGSFSKIGVHRLGPERLILQPPIGRGQYHESDSSLHFRPHTASPRCRGVSYSSAGAGGSPCHTSMYLFDTPWWNRSYVLGPRGMPPFLLYTVTYLDQWIYGHTSEEQSIPAKGEYFRRKCVLDHREHCCG